MNCDFCVKKTKNFFKKQKIIKMNVEVYIFDKVRNSTDMLIQYTFFFCIKFKLSAFLFEDRFDNKVSWSLKMTFSSHINIFLFS